MVADALRFEDSAGNVQDAIGRAHRCSPVFLDNQTHLDFFRMERISVLLAEAKTGWGFSLITASISFKPWPVSVQTIVASSGSIRKGHWRQSFSLQHFTNPRTETARAGSTKSPSLNPSHRWAERISLSDTISIAPPDSLNADFAIF